MDADTAMPTTIAPLRERCVAVMGRRSPVCSPQSSDVEDNDSDELSETMETDFNNIQTV